MKKLMIAAAIVCAAAFAQAASVSWVINSAVDPTGAGEMGDGDSFYAYLFVDSMTDSSGSTTAFTKAAALDAIAAGDLSFLSNAVDSDEVFYGIIGNGAGDFANGGASDNVVSAYAIILDTDTPASATKVYVTDVASTSINSMGASDAIDFGDITASGDYANWATVGGGSSVPEPTSGLLMLLGVAGLALRRRRA